MMRAIVEVVGEIMMGMLQSQVGQDKNVEEDAVTENAASEA